MPVSVQVVGKLERQHVEATNVLSNVSRRLFLKERRSNTHFLIDSGSDVSIIPASKILKKLNPICKLTAANSSSINVYKQQVITLDFNLRRNFTHTFLVGDVDRQIIGADFLYEHGLVPDLRNKCLIDVTTNMSSKGAVKPAQVHSLKHPEIITNTPYQRLLAK